jgi:hypothetical protein
VTLWQIIIVFGGLGLLAIMAAVLLPQMTNPVFWLKLVPSILAAILPILAKRATPEQEAEGQRQYRQGGDGNVPLGHKRPGQRKWLFGKGGIFGEKQ